ncbi:MAG: site-specific tyrosine recombinase/integron integrase [archaeon]
MKYNNIIQDYEEYLIAEKGYSDTTKNEYTNDIIRFFKFNNDQHIEEIEKRDISKFLNHLIMENNISSSTRNRKLFALRSFFQYLKKYNYIEDDPTIDIESMKTTKNKEPIYMKKRQIKAFLDAIERDNGCNNIRNNAIIKLFLYTGLRLSELASLNKDDIDFANRQIKINGKGNKERIIPLHLKATKAIHQYLNNRDDDIPALFISTRKNRISKRQIQRLVRKYAMKTQIKNKEKITAHKLRHTFASLVYKNNKDLKVLQDLLGHENISTTQIYTHTDKTEKKKNINSLDF